MTRQAMPTLANAQAALADPEAWQKLVAQLPQLPDKTASKLAPLMAMAIHHFHEERAIMVIGQMLEARPEWVNARVGEKDETALAMAVRKQWFDLMDFLIAKGADPTKRNEDGYDALVVATEVQVNHRVQEILAGALLETGWFKKKQLSFAMIMAVENDNLGAARGLLKHGADFSVSIEDASGIEIGNALQAAASKVEDLTASTKILKLLLEHPDSKRLLNRGWGTDAGSMAHAAAYIGNSDNLALIVAAGARLNPKDGQQVNTPLMSAAFGLNPHCMEILLRAGADASCVDGNGRNAFHHLADTDSDLDNDDQHEFIQESIQLLAQAGCDPFVKDEHGKTAVEMAQSGPNPGIASMIRTYFEQRDMEANTPAAEASSKAMRL